MEDQHDSFETDTRNIVSESPSEQGKTEELKDELEILQKQKLWLPVNKRLQFLKTKQNLKAKRPRQRKIFEDISQMYLLIIPQ